MPLGGVGGELGLRGGELGLREPDHSALCKPSKGGSYTNEQTHRNFQWAQYAVLL